MKKCAKLTDLVDRFQALAPEDARLQRNSKNKLKLRGAVKTRWWSSLSTQSVV
jgi:hypothetical protein